RSSDWVLSGYPFSRHVALERGVPRLLPGETVDPVAVVLLECADERLELVAILPIVAVLLEVIAFGVPPSALELVDKPLIPSAVEDALRLPATDTRVRLVRAGLRSYVPLRAVGMSVTGAGDLPLRLSGGRALRERADDLRGLRRRDRVL